MAVDLRSVTRAAAEAALGDVAPKKKGLSPWRALAIGAGLVTAGRIATGRPLRARAGPGALV